MPSTARACHGAVCEMSSLPARSLSICCLAHSGSLKLIARSTPNAAVSVHGRDTPEERGVPSLGDGRLRQESRISDFEPRHARPRIVSECSPRLATQEAGQCRAVTHLQRPQDRPPLDLRRTPNK